MYIAASEYFTSEQSGYIASVWFIERMCFKLYNSFFYFQINNELGLNADGFSTPRRRRYLLSCSNPSKKLKVTNLLTLPV
jgi:hypothetical protein